MIAHPPDAESMTVAAPSSWLTTLASQGKLAAAALDRARRLHAETDDALDVILARLGLVSETDIAWAFAESLGLPLAQAADVPAEPVLPDQLRPGFLRPVRALPLGETQDGLVLAMANPEDDETAESIAYALQRPVLRRVAPASEIERWFDRLYGTATQASPRQTAAPDAAEDLDRLRDLASDAPVIRLVNRWINQAVEAGASDIHIEPQEDTLRMRLRIDGVLADTDIQPAHLHAAVVSRLKIMARLDIGERRLTQDGAITQAVRGRDVDIRVSIIPTVRGESAVLRILDSAGIPLDFATLGYDGASLARYKSILERPHGVVLVTGPTGSGKTTTLYASLLTLRRPQVKILTVEDPVEYRLDGINQTQVEPRIGLDFAAVLRSFLRHDPDVILVGEIRDTETARIAVRAALVGRLVLSTLHTNDAASSVARLLDMGAEPYLITATVNGIVAQRLIRRLCPVCRQPYAPDAATVDSLDLRPLVREGETPTLWRAGGCPKCNGIGYRGRLAICEVLVMTESLQALVIRQAPAAELRRMAMAEGMETLYQNGARKALAGLTTIEEVSLVTGSA